MLLSWWHLGLLCCCCFCVHACFVHSFIVYVLPKRTRCLVPMFWFIIVCLSLVYLFLLLLWSLSLPYYCLLSLSLILAAIGAGVLVVSHSCSSCFLLFGFFWLALSGFFVLVLFAYTGCLKIVCFVLTALRATCPEWSTFITVFSWSTSRVNNWSPWPSDLEASMDQLLTHLVSIVSGSPSRGEDKGQGGRAVDGAKACCNCTIDTPTVQ